MSRATAALIAAAAAAALAFDPSATALGAKKAAVLLAALGALALALPRAFAHEKGLPVGLAAWLPLVGWATLSMSWAEHPSAARPTLWIGGAALAAALALRPEPERRRAAHALGTLIALGSSLAAIFQALAGARGMAIHGGHGNPNWLGLTLAAALPLALSHARAARSGWRFAALAAIALGAIALGLAASYVAFVALAIAAVATLRGRLRVAVSAASALALLPALATGRLQHALAGRLWIWNSSAAAWSAPLAGHGHGDYPFRFLEAQGLRLAPLRPDDAALSFVNATTAHHDVLQLAIEGGALALLLLALVLVASLVALWRRFPGGAGALIAIAACALGDSPLEQPAVVVVLAAVLSATPSLTPRPRLDRAALAALLGAAAVALPHAGASWLAERTLTRAMSAPAHERAAIALRAVRLAPWSGEAELAAGLAQLELGDPAAAAIHLERSRALFANVGTDVALGNAHAELGDDPPAIAAYRRALAKHPALFSAHANLAEILRRAGRLDEAEAHVTLARDRLPHDPKILVIAERIRQSRIDAATR